MKKVMLFSLIILGLWSAWLVGQLTVRRGQSAAVSRELALADNSLIHRFTPASAKPVKPVGIFKLTNDAGRFLHVPPASDTVEYYLPSSGEIRQVKIAGNGIAAGQVIGELKKGFTDIVWAPDGKTLLATNGSGWSYYNLATGETAVLDSHSGRLVFSPTGGQIAYLFYDPSTGNGSISVADPRGTIFKNILATRTDQWRIAWRDSQTLLLTLGNTRFTLDIANGDLQRTELADQSAGCIQTSREQTYCPDDKLFSVLTAPPRELTLAGLEDYLVFVDGADSKLYALVIGRPGP